MTFARLTALVATWLLLLASLTALCLAIGA